MAFLDFFRKVSKNPKFFQSPISMIISNLIISHFKLYFLPRVLPGKDNKEVVHVLVESHESSMSAALNR